MLSSIIVATDGSQASDRRKSRHGWHAHTLANADPASVEASDVGSLRRRSRFWIKKMC
jgi:hypothetical protein